jgi:hypothetical protein
MVIRSVSLADRLLSRAGELYDDPSLPLGRASRHSGRSGFRSGAQWMQLCLYVLRGEWPIGGDASFQWLGVFKYSQAVLGFTLVARLSPHLAPLAVFVFYLIEAQSVFLFPLALDGVQNLWTESRRLTLKAGGTLPVAITAMRLAQTMLLGGFPRCGFRRSWCLGCLAVVLWYEEVRLA